MQIFVAGREFKNERDNAARDRDWCDWFIFKHLTFCNAIHDTGKVSLHRISVCLFICRKKNVHHTRERRRDKFNGKYESDTIFKKFPTPILPKDYYCKLKDTS